MFYLNFGNKDHHSPFNFWNRFAFSNGFSGQTLYEQLVFQFYNVFYTSLPIIVYAVMDQEKSASELLDKAYNYIPGMKSIK